MAGADTPVPALQPIPSGVACDTSLPSQYTHHLHVSHSNADAALASHLSTQLEGKGFKLLRISPGQSNFMSLDSSWKIVLLVSPDYMSSSRREFETANHLEKSAHDRKRLVIPVLHRMTPDEVPSYIREVNYLQTSDTRFWQRLINAIGEDVTLSATIPEVDIADGLAWSYYYGYLLLVLPGIQERTRENEETYENIFNKFIILMPSSGFCAKDIKELDSNITSAGSIKFAVNRSANVERDYNSAVLKLVDPDTSKIHHVIMEYATPLWTMYEMEMGRIAGLGQQDKLKEVDQFNRILSRILNQSRLCNGKYTLLPYDDRVAGFQDDPHALSRLVAGRIRDET